MTAIARLASRPGWRTRLHPAYGAFLLHRISGLLLMLFLPVHFWVLGQALHAEAQLDAFLRWTDQPLVKAAEVVLIALFAAHFAGGVRLLVLEFLVWRPWQQYLLPSAIGVVLTVVLLFASGVA